VKADYKARKEKEIYKYNPYLFLFVGSLLRCADFPADVESGSVLASEMSPGADSKSEAQ